MLCFDKFNTFIKSRPALRHFIIFTNLEPSLKPKQRWNCSELKYIISKIFHRNCLLLSQFHLNLLHTTSLHHSMSIMIWVDNKSVIVSYIMSILFKNSNFPLCLPWHDSSTQNAQKLSDTFACGGGVMFHKRGWVINLMIIFFSWKIKRLFFFFLLNKESTKRYTRIKH